MSMRAHHVIAVVAAGTGTAGNPLTLAWRLLCRIGTAVGRGIRVGTSFRAAVCELDQLADHDLRDLRIGRSDISHTAWHEAQRRSRGGEP
jgi:hypothetical protein